jgi:hypothetical protein
MTCDADVRKRVTGMWLPEVARSIATEWTRKPLVPADEL